MFTFAHRPNSPAYSTATVPPAIITKHHLRPEGLKQHLLNLDTIQSTPSVPLEYGIEAFKHKNNRGGGGWVTRPPPQILLYSSFYLYPLISHLPKLITKTLVSTISYIFRQILNISKICCIKAQRE
jgi:hypothetical protein